MARTPPENARYRCGTCGAMFVAWATAQRHADTHGGARVEWQL